MVSKPDEWRIPQMGYFSGTSLLYRRPPLTRKGGALTPAASRTCFGFQQKTHSGRFADDPGAGKTIMTGILVKELMPSASLPNASCLLQA
jgi:hypothetical protein